jgi:RNA polymerase sporulation-specific sigma factor
MEIDRGVLQARSWELARESNPRGRQRCRICPVVLRYVPGGWRVVWSLHPPPGCEREDLAQEARIGLLAAIRPWQPRRGPFPAFAARCVRNQALLAIKAAARHKHQFLTRAISLNYEYGGDATSSGEPWALSLLDAVPTTSTWTDPEMRLLMNEELRSLGRAMPSLTVREKRAIAGMVEGCSYAEVGRSIGGSTKAASHAVDRARRKLAAALRQAA